MNYFQAYKSEIFLFLTLVFAAVALVFFIAQIGETESEVQIHMLGDPPVRSPRHSEAMNLPLAPPDFAERE
jgi:hypothetical protein